MNTDKQAVEEMARDMCKNKEAGNSRVNNCADCICYGICCFINFAQDLYNKDYRKQSVGEWHTVVDNKDDIVTECSVCKKHFWFMKKGQLNIDRMPYCPNCGAKMKGGAE